MLDLGVVKPGRTLRLPFSSFDKDDGSAITCTNFAVGDILIYKDGNTTERASTSGYTATTDFDGKTGKHVAIIDLADNTTSAFFNAGSEYLVAIDSVTIDGVTTGGWIARFEIGYTEAVLNTTIATLSSQTSFTLTNGPAEDDAINGCWVVIHDIASAVQVGRAIVDDYTGSTKTVTLAAGTTFTAAAGDNISIMGPAPLQPTVAARKLDVSTGGEAGVDWANIGSPTTALALTGTTIATTQKVDVETIKTQAVTAAAGVTFPTSIASPTNITAGTITTATNLTNAPTSGDFTATMKTSIGTAVAASAVASVTGNVGGSVASVLALANNSVTAAALATDAVTEIQAGLATPTNITAGTITTVTNLTNAPTSGDFTATMKTSIGTAVAASAVASVTGNVGGNVTGSIGSLASQAKADVNAEAVDALNVDTYAEPGQGAPAATASLVAKIGYLYKFLRNRKTQTATTLSVYADDATTVDQKATVSDNGTTFDHGEIATGP